MISCSFPQDLDETCREKKNHLKHQQWSLKQTLHNMRCLEEEEERRNGDNFPANSPDGGCFPANSPETQLDEEDVEEPDNFNSNYDVSVDFSTSYGENKLLSQSLRGRNFSARTDPMSGSNHLQPIECSYVDVTFNQMLLLHMLDTAVEKHVMLNSAQASPAKTRVVVGPALVDHVTNVKIMTRYSDGEECEMGGEPLNAQLSCPDGSKISGAVTDNGNGTYVVSFKPTHPGSHILSLSIQDTPIGHSPYDFYVSPVCPSKCTSDRKPCMVDYAGLTTITTRDSNGTKCFFGGEKVEADLRDPHGTPLKCAIDDNNNGTYHITYNPTIAGIHCMKVAIHGEDIENNPVEIPVRAINARQTKVKIKRPRLNKPSHVILQAVDHRGKRLRHGGDHITARLYDENDYHQKCVVKDNRNGSYTLTYVPDVPGEYLLGITIHQWALDRMFVVWVPDKQPGAWQNILDAWDDIWEWIENRGKHGGGTQPAMEPTDEDLNERLIDDRGEKTERADETTTMDGEAEEGQKKKKLDRGVEEVPDDGWCLIG